MIHTKNVLEENHTRTSKPTCRPTIDTFNNQLNVSVEILNEDVLKSVYSNNSKDMYDRDCSKLSPDTLCELTNMQSYVAQESESVVGSQFDSVKSSVMFNQSLSFDLQLLLSLLVVLTIVYTCKYLLYMSNTALWFPAKGLRIAHLNINHIMGKIDPVKLILDNLR